MSEVNNEFEQMLDESFKTIRNGEVLEGKVISVKPDEAVLNIGYKADGIVPILMPSMDPTWFASNASYPLPYGLVLTSIVIGASTLAVMLALVMVLYRKYGTLSTSVMLADTSKQEEYDE